MKCSHAERGKLTRDDWMESEKERLFPCCESFFRLPISMEGFINIAANPGFFECITDCVKVNIKSNSIHINRTDDMVDNDGGDMNLTQSSSLPMAAFKKIKMVQSGLFSADEEENQNSIAMGEVSKFVIRKLLDGHPSFTDGKFDLLSVEQIYQLCIAARDILAEEATIVEIEAPCRVFGDIRGHLREMLTLFKTFGSPNHYTGDVELSTYVFNGNFIDNGPQSLEIICLMFSLKILYPKNVILIRGSHEDPVINATRGFKDECMKRLPDDYGEPIWELFNHVFGFLPLGGVIENKIMVVHGGIGPSFTHISQVQNMKKPILQPCDNPITRDILWATPAESDSLKISVKQVGAATFDMNQVVKFCLENGLELIIRSHECVSCGYEFFSGGHLITVFSAGDYLQKGNSGACLTISSKLSIRAKSISPNTIKSQYF